MSRALNHDKANAQIRGERQIERDQRHEARWKPRNRQARREEYLAALNPLPVTISGTPAAPLPVQVSRLQKAIETHPAVASVEWQDDFAIVTFRDPDLLRARIACTLCAFDSASPVAQTPIPLDCAAGHSPACLTRRVRALEAFLREIDQPRALTF